ncbi:ABC transporter ATP-binding protein [Robertkochia flava]|uniref:ABC transporter ATP-binding protein n=1 Tax=Robertkochia flava TaxID=3447986 RepID=UPI001CC974DE|nr:ABC transporter ATP-binding protein [Robertkochia marina]
MNISAREIQKTYGKTTVLNQVSITCQAGEVVGLLGLNGAGKSTLFKILMGLVSPDHGEVVTSNPHKKQLGGIIEKPALYEYLNARDNLRIFAEIQGAASDSEALNAGLRRVGLDVHREDKVGNYSMGMKQRLAIAIALLNDPPFLVLDEPFSGLDPMGVIRLRNLILELAKEKGIGVLVSSHLVDEMIRTCDRIYVINRGEIIREDSPRVLVDQATRSYVLTGESLDQSEVLKGSGAHFQGNSARITDPHPNIGALLKELGAEGTTLYSCVPETDIKMLLHAGND